MLHKPLTALVSYVLITLALFLFGPWVYDGVRYPELLVFLTAFVVLVSIGYTLGARARVQVPVRVIRRSRIIYGYSFLIVPVTLIKSLVVVQLFQTQGSTLGLSLVDFGSTYRAAIETSQYTSYQTANALVQLETLAGLGTQVALIVGFLYFRHLSKAVKCLLLLLILLILAKSLLFRGTQIGIGNLFIYWLSARLIVSLRSGAPIVGKWVLMTWATMMSVFMFVQMSRLSAYNVDVYSISISPLMYIDHDHILFRAFGDIMGVGIAVLLTYVSMGYYGLSLSFAQPFIWTYGLGNSFALSSYAEQYLGMPPQIDFTYPLRVQAATGWPALMYWQTAFPWLASDLTFPGTLVLLSVVAYVYARAFKEALLHNNVLSLVLFATLNVLWLFIPANNQLMQERESAIAVLLLFFLWLVLHNRFNGPRLEVQDSSPPAS